MSTNHHDPLEARVLNDPASSYWLRDRILDTRNRDPLDALRDAEMLVKILKARVQRALASSRAASPPSDA